MCKRGRHAREENALYDFEIVSREWAGGKFFSLSETFMKKWNFFHGKRPSYFGLTFLVFLV